ncbi:MAG: hypothetical protein RIT45_2418, partial [Pseudomonadota bacterium]
FYGFTNPWVREHERALLEREIPAAMQAKGCTAMLVDSATHELPPAIAAFVAAHFQPWDADLWLWARQLPGGGNALRAHDVAIWRAGEYDVAPEAAIAAGAVRVDGRTVTARRLRLTAGSHRFEVGGPGVSLRWVPADGSVWTPRPEGEPRLRHVL